MKGAFIISREIFDNPIWEDVQKFRIFFYILGNAVFSEEGIKKGNIHIKRGQYLRSYRNLRKDLEYVENRSVKQYSISTIKRKIEQLVKEERLKIEDTELGTLFTVCNYDDYQLLDNYKKKHETPLEQTENSSETVTEQRQNNNKNVKEGKEGKEDNIPYAEIIDYLNKKANKKFKHTAGGNKKVIKARWNEGATLDDFKHVIDVCVSKWKGKTFSNGKPGDDYLQPSTLFNQKFDERLNWNTEQPKQQSSQMYKDLSDEEDEIGRQIAELHRG